LLLILLIFMKIKHIYVKIGAVEYLNILLKTYTFLYILFIKDHNLSNKLNILL
jgi:hypothetical protein